VQGAGLGRKESGTSGASEPEWLTTREAAARIGFSPRHVRNLVRDGLLEARDLGRGQHRARWRLSRASLEEFLAFRTQEGTEGNGLRRGAVHVRVTEEGA
jgi:excisionase family DNA binding protein